MFELVKVVGKVWLGWLWQSGRSRWSGRTGKSKGQGVLNSLIAWPWPLTSTTPVVMGGFGVILMPKKISTTTTLDYFEIYVTLLKNMVQNFKKFTTISKHGTKLQKFHKILKQGIEKRCISSSKKVTQNLSKTNFWIGCPKLSLDQPVDLPKTNFLESKSWFLTPKSCFSTLKNCFLATG